MGSRCTMIAELWTNFEQIMNANTSKPASRPTVPVAPGAVGQCAAALGGHEATETGLAYAPVSQAHGHNHIVHCFPCCTAAQTSCVPHHVVADCALASVLWTLKSARTHHPPTVPVSL